MRDNELNEIVRTLLDTSASDPALPADEIEQAVKSFSLALTTDTEIVQSLRTAYRRAREEVTSEGLAEV